MNSGKVKRGEGGEGGGRRRGGGDKRGDRNATFVRSDNDLRGGDEVVRVVVEALAVKDEVLEQAVIVAIDGVDVRGVL